MEKDKLQEFIDDVTPIIKRHNLEGIILLVGIKKTNDIIDEAAFVSGDNDYLAQLLNNTIIRNKQLHDVVDNVALAVAIKKDTDN